MEDALFCEVQFSKQSKKQKFTGKENTIGKTLKHKMNILFREGKIPVSSIQRWGIRLEK